MSGLQIHVKGSEVLKQIAEPVGNIKDPDFQTFIDDLIAACFEYDGVGIAAPQVGVSKRVFIIASRPNSRYKNAPEIEPVAIINPGILSQSSEVAGEYEGCLSIPEKRGLVCRSTEIEVEFTNRYAEKINTRLSGFLARVFLHEYDHLEGILYPERMSEGESLITLDEYHELMQHAMEQKTLEEGE